jgi:cytochrome b561
MVERYTSSLKLLHWLMAALIIGLFAVGLLMGDLPKGDLRGTVYGLHKGFGVIVLALLAVRLASRLKGGVPDLPPAMGQGERMVAKWGHVALYALMALVPVAGILMSQSGGHPVAVMGWTLPTLVGKDEGIHEIFEEAHEVLSWTMAAIVAGHVLAALRHHFALKDGVLTRMLPGRG